MSARPSVSGFTLIEILVVTVIFFGIAGTMFMMLIIGKNALWSQEAYVSVQQEARRALDVMGRELHGAGNIDTDLTAAGDDTPAGGANRLNFQVTRGYNVAGCTANDVCWGNDNANGGWVHYIKNGAQLVRCQSDAADTAVADYSACRVLANDVNVFGVDYVGATETVTLRLAVRQTSDQLPGGSMTTVPNPLRTQVRLRNS